MQVELSEKYVKGEDIEGIANVKFKIIEEPIIVTGQYGKKIECRIVMKKGKEEGKAKWTLTICITCKLAAIRTFSLDFFGIVRVFVH